MGNEEMPVLTWRQWELIEPLTAESPSELWARARRARLAVWEPADVRLALVRGIGAQWIVATLHLGGSHQAEGTIATRTGGWGRVRLLTCDLREERGFRVEILTGRSHDPGAAVSGQMSEVTIVDPHWDDPRVTRVCRLSLPSPEAPPVVLGQSGPGSRWVAYPAWRAPGAGWAPSGAYVRNAGDPCGAVTGSYPLPLHDSPQPLGDGTESAGDGPREGDK
jgi:hypothetical protein